MKPISARVRIGVGLLVLLVASVAFAADPKLLVPNGAGYSGHVLLTAKGAAVKVDVTNCSFGPSGFRSSVPAGGATIVRYAGDGLCGGPFALVDVPSGVDALSIITFGGTRPGAMRHVPVQSSWSVGPIGAVPSGGTKPLGPLVSDDEERAYIAVFPAVADTPVTVRFSDAVETFLASPPVALYEIKAKGVGFATVSLGDVFYGCFPARDCSGLGAVYGLAITGTPETSTARAFPF